MMISIASGKGGTGKTTVATNLVYALGKKAQFLDCDVEAPNAHLFLKPSLHRREMVDAPVPKVDTDKCTFCRKCVEICRFGALAVLKKDVLVFENLCHSCGGCLRVCPEKAITEKKRSLGEVELGSAQGFRFVHGRLTVGQVMAPPVIKKVRSFSDKEKIIIIDAPPGTSCPVIAAMKQADYILLVTEPTPFGLHDLKLAVETVKILEIPHGVVINRADLGTDGVRQYCGEQGIPVLMEIPFDETIARVYSRGDLVADVLPAYREKFRALYGQIVRQLKEIKEKGAVQ